MDTPDFFVGARLGAARTKAGISLEKAAHDTRVSIQRLSQLEADDFSDFSHPTYTRLFLLDYAGYLGVPQDEIFSLLPSRDGAASGGFQYINILATVPSLTSQGMSRRRRRIFIFLGGAGLFICLVAGVFFTYLTFKKMERVARSKSPEALVESPPVISESQSINTTMKDVSLDPAPSSEPITIGETAP